MLRIIVALMAALVLGLSCLPCCDAAPTASAAQAKGCSKQEHGTNKEDCSPFCACACCSAVTTPARSILLKQGVPEVLRKTYGRLKDPETSEIPLPIWQPPQLV